jgi:hypothetical protein
MKNALYWDKNPSSYVAGDAVHLQQRTQPINFYVRLDVFTSVTMKNAVY